MKKILNIISSAIIAIAAIACDPVSEDERFIKAEGINPNRKVLVQEFTGQFCPNCPLGHEALDNIKKQYGKNAIIVSIHAGEMAFDDKDYGLKTPDGDIYAKEWGIDQYPSAVVNRRTVLTNRSQWQGAVLTAGIMPPKVKIELSAVAKDGRLNIHSVVSSEEQINDVRFQLMIVEDNVTAMQQNGEDYIMDYVHNHVYRASPGGIGGNAISLGNTIELNNPAFPLDPKWNVDNLNVILYVYDNNEVLQAEEVKVVK